MTFKYENPVARFNIGDVVRFGTGKVEWTIVDKGATTGLSLKNARGAKRRASTFEVSLVRRGKSDD